MNFLLHRHFAARELSSPVAGVGAMLPDLWRLAHRRVRARRDVAASEVTGELQRGVDHHIEADRWFHKTAAFVDGERALVHAFRDADLKAPKLGMFAHMAWEMCLDGALLMRGELDADLAQLSADFDEAGQVAQRALADVHGAARLEPAERRRFDERMDRIRDGLCDGPWLSSYMHGDGICGALMRMRMRFGFQPLAGAAQQKLGLVLEARLRHAAAAVEALLAERSAMQGDVSES